LKLKVAQFDYPKGQSNIILYIAYLYCDMYSRDQGVTSTLISSSKRYFLKVSCTFKKLKKYSSILLELFKYPHIVIQEKKGEKKHVLHMWYLPSGPSFSWAN